MDVGFAAHITAASPGGPRFDSTLTPDQRKHHSNGIWLCGTHAKLIDSDESHFTVEELHAWKRLAMRRSFQEVVSSAPSLVEVQLDDDADVQAVLDLLRGYSESDLQAFQRMPGWPPHTVALNLKMADEKATKVFTATGLALASEIFDEFTVIAPPGTGKTTTLLQLTDAIIGNTPSVAVFVSLSEWSTRSDTFFQSVVRHAAFREANERQFELLGEHGKLVLVLDGWNELDEASKRRARTDITLLRREYPDIRLVISSRYKDPELPIDGPVVEIDGLTEEQQLEIAKALRGSEGESLLDHAWRLPGLRELVAIPLYLTALLKQVPGGSFPSTKEEVLRAFVEELERDPDKQAILREVFQGYHRDYLEALSVEAMRQGTVALSETQGRTVANAVQLQLKDDNQIAQPLQPMAILDALVSAHMLIRPGAESGGVLFQHQQFQEWFASLWVQRLMRLAVQGDDGAVKELRENVLNITTWEEAILFACERLSRESEDGMQAVGHAIIETLGIDPLLSAEMIYRSSDQVWEQVREVVTAFAGKWHTESRVDRAVNFMIGTGRAEFSQYVWPLISDPDNQVHLRALRSGRKFRPGILGMDVQDRVAALPEELRKDIISEIAMNSGIDGIELATRLAVVDESMAVKMSVIESLFFRHAGRFAKDILETVSDEVWRSLAGKWHAHEVSNRQVSERLAKEAAELHVTEPDPHNALNRLLSSGVRDPENAVTVQALIEQIDYSETTQNNRWLAHRAYELYPQEVVGAFVSLLESDKPVPYGADEVLRSSDVIVDHGPLAECVLVNSSAKRCLVAAASVVGPVTIGQLIDQALDIHLRIKANDGRYDKTLSDESHRIVDLISSTKAGSFIRAILARPETQDPVEIAFLAGLVSRHGAGVERKPMILEDEERRGVTDAIQTWGNVLLASSEATRAQFATIAQASERLGSQELVPVLRELLSEDLVRRKRDMEEFLDGLKHGRRIENGAQMCWGLQYRRAFSAIGDEQTIQIMKGYLPDHDFGVDAACVLKAIWHNSHGPEDSSDSLWSRPEFSGVPDEYARRQAGEIETHHFVHDILTVVADLIKPGKEEADYVHALNLAAVAFSIPYTGQDEMIASLLELPRPIKNKRNLLNVLARSGQVIASEKVLQGIDELLEEAKTKPWLLHEQNGWQLNEWLKLLPFTERPEAVLDVLDRLEGRRLDPWNLRELLSALSYSPSGEAETVIGGLAERDARFLGEHSWLESLIKRNTLTAANILLDLVCNVSLSGVRGAHGRVDFGKALSSFMSFHDLFRREVYERFQGIDNGLVKSVIGHAIAEASDTEGVLLLVRDAAGQGKQYRDTDLYSALSHVLVGHTPVGSSGMQELYSLPAIELRKELFTMVVNGSSEESRLATECLIAIDEIRDDYGYVDVEPRHPDITAGMPWPQVGHTETA